MRNESENRVIGWIFNNDNYYIKINKTYKK
jgi:hypothetical protein